MNIHNRIAKLFLKSCATTIKLYPSNEWLLVGNDGGNVQIWAAPKLSKNANAKDKAVRVGEIVQCTSSPS